MNNFLKYLATELYKQHGPELSEYCFVFPNKRAGLFFSKYLSEITIKPLWAPPFLTINELFGKISPLHVADSLYLIFELYKVYKLEKKTEESFDDFYFWGETMLNDFDDVDKNLVDTRDLFQNLKALKTINDQFSSLSPEQIEIIREFFTHFDPEKYGKHKENFIQIWSVLLNIYNNFNEHLQKQEFGSEGMIYRQVAQSISRGGTLKLPYQKFIFIGFNALNTCEQKLLTYLKNLGVAQFYWDYDEYYLGNRYHEAGYFMRENLLKFPSPANDFNFNRLTEKDKSIEFFSVPSNVGQTKLIKQILDNWNAVGSMDKNRTAIVLADEQLLMPVLYAIPPEIEEVNVTMGYPLQNTPISNFVGQLLNLQRNVKTGQNGTYRFHHKDVMTLLKHQYMQQRKDDESEKLAKDIVQSNKIFLSPEELNKSPFLNSIFIKTNDTGNLCQYLLNVLFAVYRMMDDQDYGNSGLNANLEKEYIYQLYLAIQRLQDILKESRISIEIKTFIRLLGKLMQSLRVPFTGEPLAGIQVMGILETRLLDFENIILLSMNEGNLPQTSANISFIPYNLRRGFGLPTIEHQDSIYAYYFYRLIQRAKKIALVYTTQSDDLGSGEMSRFLYQLKYEPDFNIVEKHINYDITNTRPKEITIPKTAEIFTLLAQYFKGSPEGRYLSPSALNTYINCSLKFYFMHLAKIEEPEEITEEVDAALFGNLLHKSIYLLYEPFAGKEITTETLSALQKDKTRIYLAILLAFSEEYYMGNTAPDKIELSGRNLIIKEVLLKYINQIFEVDKHYAPFSMVSLEKKYTLGLEIEIEGHPVKIELGGKIDRLDKIGETYRIVDYKTGKADRSFNTLESLFDSNKKKRNGAALQTLLYAELYASQNKQVESITPSLYSVKELFGSEFDYRLKWGMDRNKQTIDNYLRLSDEFLPLLKSSVEEIFDKDKPFLQAEDEEKCKVCPYKGICHRG
jgi:hypothetical protein